MLVNTINDDLDLNIDVPFQNRTQCWFCGEPRHSCFRFPHKGHVVLACPHPTVVIPSCNECRVLALNVKKDSIWQIRKAVKSALMKLYRKDLAIGIHWTEQELLDSGFEEGNFAGFQKSAWFMYEVAKGRINFSGWTLSLRGIDLVNTDEKASFIFDGVTFPTIDEAVSHYCLAFDLHKSLFKSALDKIGIDRFADAVRFCRLHVLSTPNEKQLALNDLN